MIPDKQTGSYREAMWESSESDSVVDRYYDVPTMRGIVEIREDDLYFLAGNLLPHVFGNAKEQDWKGRLASELGFPDPVRRDLIARFEASARTGGRTRFEYDMETPGGLRRLQATVSPAGASPSGAPRFCYIVEDLTDSKVVDEAVERLERERAARSRSDTERRQITAILERITDAFYAVDRDWRFMYVNDHAQRLLQCKREDLLGRTVWEVFPEVLDTPFFETFQRAMRDGEFTFIEDYYAPLRTWFEVRAYPSDDGVSIYFQDVTQRKAAEDALRESEERLRLAHQAVGIGTWDWDLLTDRMNWSPEFLSLYAMDEEVHPSLDSWLAAIVEEDRAATMEEGRVCLEIDKAFRSEHRIVRKDGEVRWILNLGRVLRDPDGIPARMIGIAMDTTDRKRLEMALTQSNRAKDEFLAVLSHELRNPLGAISNVTELLRAQAETGELLAGSVDILDRQVRQVTRLVDDLLDVSRITRGHMELRRESLDLSRLIQRVVDNLKPKVKERGHSLGLSLPDVPVFVFGDPARLEQVASNLLNNAVKYTPAGGAIRLSLAVQDGEAVMEVADNGLGISPEVLPQIFDLFMRDGRIREKAMVDGLGIGLTLVQRLAEMHGGRVDAFSEGAGKGSRFTVVLPCQAAGEFYDAQPLLPVASHAPSSAQTRRILVVDDNKDAAATLCDILELWGHTVVSVHTGPEAVLQVSEFHPDVVLLDIDLPGLSGYEVAARLAPLPDRSSYTLIAVTGFGQKHDHDRSLASGFDHHLVKPLDLGALRALLTNPSS